MGGWWPEYSTPDTGVRPARQFTPACTRSSAHSCGKLELPLGSYFIVFIITPKLVGLWLSVGFVFVHLTCSIMNVSPVLYLWARCASHTGGISCNRLNLLISHSGTIDVIRSVQHSFIGFHFHQLTEFSLDTCMLV